MKLSTWFWICGILYALCYAVWIFADWLEERFGDDHPENSDTHSATRYGYFDD